ncbi:MAG: MATE family efflux transporter [Butyrivibrio sp.]|uniref:MATE family efflux transporter n=1 Tax=Butyrivibrio sp. TaxID=28121 RepID=UPI0025E28003|nr:MATE family efflux transporter [Butyrivibrio sp.]MCR5770281.1 MATE family efflux transporter [Butyrivibrio sp.]
MSSSNNNSGHIFSNHDLLLLVIPVIAEQFLTSLMGLADSMMVSNVNDYSLGAVQLVDSINILVNQAFAALATGGVVVCSNFIGQKKTDKAEKAARQVSLSALVLSVSITIVCLLLRNGILNAVFGKVEEALMAEAQVYFFITILSFPGIALYNAGSAIYRAQGNTKRPLAISIVCNFINIAGNAIFIYVFGLGVAGAALSTFLSRWLSAIVVFAYLHNKNQMISIRDYKTIRPDAYLIKRVLALGIPNGIENSMFQFGKLVIQSTVSTMGTIAITAQAMTNIMENVNGVAACGVGIGLMTVVGQSLGAGRKDEARYYIKKLAIWAEIAIIASCLFVFAIRGPITSLGGMNEASARLCMYMCGLITIVKPLFWVPSFLPAYGMRAAGDVRFSMILSVISMWLVRVGVTLFLVYVVGFVSPVSVWCGMFSDWFVRGVFFAIRFKSGKWLEHRVA